jgi:hypothetical protein
MLRPGPRSSCREGWKKLVVLGVPCLYICALMLFAVKNPHISQTNASVYGMNTRQHNKLRIPSVRHYSMKIGVCHSYINILNQLP